MQERNYKEIVEKVGEEIKAMVKGLLEGLMVEERRMYLENHPTKANGYYTRDLLTLHGPLEGLRVPRVREGEFGLHPYDWTDKVRRVRRDIPLSS